MFKLNRDRLIERIKEYNVPNNSVVLLQGNKYIGIDDTDKEFDFRQESNFHYLFGVTEADCFGMIDILNKKSILLVPKRDTKYAVWNGKILDLDWYYQTYDVDDVIYTSDIDKIKSIIKADSSILIIGTPNIYTKKTLPEINLDELGIKDYVHLLRRDVLYHAICDIRVIKTNLEIDLLQHINKVSSDAHIKVMKSCKSGMIEDELAMIFYQECLAYQSIVGTGTNSAILHYCNNTETIKDGDLVLCDMGCEMNLYASDITRTFPANGKFTDKQKEIYNIVLKAQNTVINLIKPGIDWSDMHWKSLEIICDGLYNLDLIQGDLNEVCTHYKDIAKYFMPHGIGHFMGKDVHDVGSANTVAYTRNKGTILKKGMVLTVEPGIYFIEPLLNEGYRDEIISKYLNREKIDQYLDFGGIRIEDDIVVTSDGSINLTSAPKTVEDIEEIMNKKI
jgi:Xaa-Pro dipeptidase